MKERLRLIALPVLAAMIALFAGLVPTLLRTGQVEPSDWLVPGFAAFAAMQLVAGRATGWRQGLFCLLLVLAPPLLFLSLASTAFSWTGALAFAFPLALAGLALRWSFGKAASWRWAMAAACVLALLGVRWLGQFEVRQTPPAYRVAVLSALPLFSAATEGKGPLDGVGKRAPLIEALTASIQPVPVDVLDDGSLAGASALLLVQPRLLGPAELVALDDWVRGGGHAVILADPFLHWPDGHALADPRRAPLTSLLDPLLTHWGLTLEPARLDGDGAIGRHILSNGALLQLAGASSFTAGRNSPCRLAESGLIARCTIGQGTALLVADADWVNDGLWTLDPAHPRDRQAWTSDAVPMLTHWLWGRADPPPPGRGWLSSQAALISALRWTLGLILLLGAAMVWLTSFPKSTHGRAVHQGVPQGDSGPADPDSG